MINMQKKPSGLYLTAVAVLGCMQLAPAANQSNAARTQAITQAAIVGASQPTMMRNAHGFVGNIETLSRQNEDFRKVVYTAKHAQLVIMALKPGEEIGSEVHLNVDQFLRIEEGSGEAILDKTRSQIHAGDAVLVPAGTKHNIVNTGKTPMKLYTLYSPPQHRDGVVQQSRAEAQQAHEHFDGRTTR